MLNNLRFVYKLLVSFSVLILILIGVGFIGHNGISKISTSIGEINKTTPLMTAATQMQLSVSQDMTMIMEMLVAEQPEQLQEAWQNHQALVSRFDTFAKAIVQGAETPEGIIYPTRDEKLQAIVKQAQEMHDTAFQPLIEQMHQMVDRRITGEAINNDKLNRLDDQADATGIKILDLLSGIEEKVHEDIIEAQQKALRAAVVSDRLILVAILVGVAVAFIFSLVMARSISAMVQKTVDFAKTMASGDFSSRLDIDQEDEIGQLAKALNQMATQLQNMFSDIQRGAETLLIASEELNRVSRQMTEGSDHTSEKAGMVATAAEEMSANMQSVAAAIEQASTNINMIAAAIDEMTSTVDEIAKNAERAQSITGKAVSRAGSTTDNVNRLGEAAQQINKVTEVITEISEQTNLLALNATIEAARAGEAGKGFAVVANEIKELAKQTAEATQEIRGRIEGIQKTTGTTVTEIVEISDVINEINDTVSEIALSVEEQARTTREISDNISQASQGIQEVNENVAQGSMVVGEIARDIHEVKVNAVRSAEDSEEVKSNVEELATLAGEMKEMVVSFNIGPERFDIGRVKRDHLAWKSRLNDIVKGRIHMQPQEVTSEHECNFGKWLASPAGQQLKDHPVYPRVISEHEKVHSLARKIVDAVNKGHLEETREMLREFNATRLNLFRALDKLYKD
ncbi:methyl-accepting chemotaxis protein [Desulfolithobacter sp.]